MKLFGHMHILIPTILLLICSGVAGATVKDLELGKKFNSTFQIWQWADYSDMSEMKTVMDNCFQKLGADCVCLGHAKCDYNNPEDRAWWDEILTYAQSKGYAIQPLCMGPGGPFWESMTPNMLKYLSAKYPDVIQLVLYESERWTVRERYIFPDKLILTNNDSKSDPNSTITVPIQDTEIGHPLKDTYSDLTKAMLLTYGRDLQKVCEAAPQAGVSFSDHWATVDVTAFMGKPYAKQLFPGRKCFGATETISHDDLRNAGLIGGWMTQLSSDGSAQPSYSPDYMERMLKRTIAEGINFWELQDYYYMGPVLFDKPASKDAKLSPWGQAFRNATDFGHAYNTNTMNTVQWTPDSAIAILSYPNDTPSNDTAFNQMATDERQRITSGQGHPTFSGNAPYYPEDYRYFPSKSFYFTTSITPKTKVAILVGPGNMNQFTVDELKAYCEKGGYVIQSCGAYIHDPETGKEMADIQVPKPQNALVTPTRSQMRTDLLGSLAGFSYATTGRSEYDFAVRVVNTDTPLVPFDYATEYHGPNPGDTYHFLEGSLIDSTVPVMTIDDEKGNPHPIVIFHKIGKGGVYTVLSWSLSGMQTIRLDEFIRKWTKYLSDVYQADVLKRDKVNLYDYEIYAGRLLDWEGKPYIEMTKDQETGIVKNYLDRPIDRTFSILAKPSEKVIQETITDSAGKVVSQNTIPIVPNNPTLVKVTLQHDWTVTIKKV